MKIKNIFSNKLTWFVALPLLIVSLFYLAKHLTINIKAYAQVHATPFVMEMDFYSFSKNPQGDLIEKRIIARRSDGSTATITFLPPHWEFGARTITYLSGERIHALDLISTKTTWQTEPLELAALKERLSNPPENCIMRRDQTFKGNESLGGVTMAINELIDSGKVTEWDAPALGCERTQVRIETQEPDGTYKLRAEGRLASIRLQEPDPGYFDPGVKYEEVRPSEAIRRTVEKMGGTQPPDSQTQAERADKYYSEHH